jgi:hypothetical protein
MIPTRVHIAMYRHYVRLFPPSHTERHGCDQVELFSDLIATGHRPLRLWIAAIPDLTIVIRHTPRRLAVSHFARFALYPLSMLNAAAGFTLAAIAVFTGAVPLWVAGPAVAVAGQGLYTLAWLRNLLPVERRAGDFLFTTGEAVALIIGTTGVVGALISQSGTADAEYGPQTMLSLIAVHGLIGLVAPTSPTPTPATARIAR